VPGSGAGACSVSAAGELHVVFGSGPVGLAVVDTLLTQGKQVRVASRSGSRRGLLESVEVMRGDATNSEDTRRVCAGASHVYSCVNAPDYHRWPEQCPPLQRGVLAGAATAGAKLIVMENLYMYGLHLSNLAPPRAKTVACVVYCASLLETPHVSCSIGGVI
jgi:uncharacterized protein YbjT (DUF2867 family)